MEEQPYHSPEAHSYTEEPDEPVHPYYSDGDLLLRIWTRPRQVINYLVEYEPSKYIIALLVLRGISETFIRAMDKQSMGTFGLTAIIFLAVFVGPLGGLLSSFIGAALLSVSGRWLDGRADSEQIRLVIAWASIPIILLLAVLPIEMILFGAEPFSKEQPTMEAHPFLTELFNTLIVGLAGWSLYIFLAGLSEIQQFSVWKALLNCLLAGLLLVVPILALVALFMGLNHLAA